MGRSMGVRPALALEGDLEHLELALGQVTQSAEIVPMGLGLRQDKPTELELRSAALEADEHFRGLPVDVQNLQRRALVEDDCQHQRIRMVGRERYRSAMAMGVGMMLLIWGLGSAPHLDTFATAVLLGMLLGAVIERIEGGPALFGIGCGLSAFLLGTLSCTPLSLFFMPIIASFLGAVFGTTRWL